MKIARSLTKLHIVGLNSCQHKWTYRTYSPNLNSSTTNGILGYISRVNQCNTSYIVHFSVKAAKGENLIYKSLPQISFYI